MKNKNQICLVTTEASVIASMIIDNSKIRPVLNEIGAEHLTQQVYIDIFNTIETLNNNGLASDLITITNELSSQGKNGDDYINTISSMIMNIPSSRNVMAYVDILKTNFATRRINQAHTEFVNGDSSDYEYLNQVSELIKGTRRNKLFDLKKALREQHDFYFGEVKDKELVFDNCMPMGEVALLTASGGTGKSFATLHLAASIALGVPAFNGYNEPFKPTKQGKVIIVGGEDYKDDYQRRIKAVLKALGKDTEEYRKKLKENLIIMSMVGNNVHIVSERSGSPFVTPVTDDLCCELSELDNVRMVILDPMSAFYGSDENNNPIATLFINTIHKVCNETGAAVMIVHHSSKGSSGSARGASGFIDRARTHISMRTVAQDKKETKGKKAYITTTDKNTIILTLEKSNHVKFWEENITLMRNKSGAFESVKYGVDDELAHFRDDLIDYLERDGTVVSKNEIEQNRAEIFHQKVSRDSVRIIINQAIECGKIAYTDKGTNSGIYYVINEENGE